MPLRIEARSMLAAMAASAALASCAAASTALDELKVKREEVFEFASPPQASRSGDRVSISFETRALCDVTVAIEDEKGKVVRHLASGVLGENAPAPFQKNARRQTLVWDGKNDEGKYIDDKDSHTVRVSLGLKPRFERTLFHSPYKRFGRNQPLLAPAPEGMYVYEGDAVDSLRLFDHEGNFLRTIYPFPNGKLDEVKGLRWHTAPHDGARLPLKEGYHQNTFLTGGYNAGFDAKTGYGLNRFLTLKHFDGMPGYSAAAGLAVHGERIALTGYFLNRMASDGSSGGMALSGPELQVTVKENGFQVRNSSRCVFPSSAAFSPDGKTLYLAGYYWDEGHGTGGTIKRWVHGVRRMAFESDAVPELFAGSLDQDRHGSGPDEFRVPAAVACDRQGRVYVADYHNDRIQVFSPEKKLLKSIPANKPARLFIHHKTGALYTCSFVLKSQFMRTEPVRVKAVLTQYGAFDDPKPVATWPLPLVRYQEDRNTWDREGGSQFSTALDTYTDPPTLWLAPASPGQHTTWEQAGLKLYALGKDKLELKRDFGAEARKAIANDSPASSARQRLSVNPRTGKVYVMEGMGLAPGDQIVEIDPESGKDRSIGLPFGAEDLCFDMQGLAYLRTGDLVARYDPADWREVPWDYGEEREGVSHTSGRAGKIISALVLPGHRASPWYHGGGFGVSPQGHLAVQVWNGAQFSPDRDRKDTKVKSEGGERYTPNLYPGRQRWGEIHVWDKRGKLLYRDAAPGLTITDGVCIDKDDNLYILTNPTRLVDGESRLNPKTETLVKVRAGESKVVTSGEDRCVPIAVGKGSEPSDPPQFRGFYQGPAWVENAEWLFGGVGFAGGRCTCHNARFALDYYARSFAPEPDRFSVAVLDSAGNVIVRMGRPGNVEDGQPLVAGREVTGTRSIGGDELAILHACYVAVDSDRRAFIADAGNRRIASVKLGYHTDARIVLKDVKDGAP